MSDTEILIEKRIAAISPAATGAIVVALEEYKEKRWNITGPLRDALEFVDWLCSRQVPAGNIQVLASAQPDGWNHALETLAKLGVPPPIRATQDNIRNSFFTELRAARYELLFVYWSGHGTATRDEAHHLLTSDAWFPDVRTHEIGRLKTLWKTDQVGANGALQHQVFFFDVCSDYAEKRDEQLERKLNAITFPAGGKPVVTRGQFVMRAAGVGYKAENRDNRGVFSRELLNFLKQQKPAAGWPEPMACVLGVRNALRELNKAGERFQVPRFNDQDWSGSDIPPFGGEGFARIWTDQLWNLKGLLADWPAPHDRLLDDAWSKLSPGLEPAPKALTGKERWHWCLEKLAGLMKMGMFFQFLALWKGSAPDAAAKAALAKWTRAAAKEIGFGVAELKEAQSDAQQLLKRLPKIWPSGDVLQVVLRPLDSLKGQERYQLHFGIFHQGAETSELQAAGARDLSLEEAEKEFGAAILNTSNSTLSGPDIRLDFILPFALFNLAVEQWEAPWGVSSSRMGTHYPTGRRFFERAYPDEAMRANPKWNLKPLRVLQSKKWSAFSKDFSPKHLCWARDPAELLEALAVADDATSVLGAATLESGAHPPASVFGGMLTSGVPVALWLQQPAVDATQVRANLDKIFKRPVAEWPADTRQFRKNPPIACENIALLWDNPLEPLPILPTYENAPLGQDI